MRHHVAPVTGGIADGEKNRFVLPTRLCERFLAPRIPVHRIVGVLEKVWRLLMRKAVRVFGICRRASAEAWLDVTNHVNARNTKRKRLVMLCQVKSLKF